MKHRNLNMIPAVLAGVEAGEDALSRPEGESMYEFQVRVIEELTSQLVPSSGGIVVGGLIKGKAIAFAQGFIAAYRSAVPCRSGDTDCTTDCGWCKGTGMQR